MKGYVLTDKAIKVDMAFRPYESPIANPPVVSTEHDQIELYVSGQFPPERLIKEFLSLTMYQQTDDIAKLQTIIDRASGAQPNQG